MCKIQDIKIPVFIVIPITPKIWQKLIWMRAYKFTKGKPFFMHLVEQLSFYQYIILICCIKM
jgi:hypothetical protein